MYENIQKLLMSEIKSRSKAWYILPILMGIIGGLIAYFAIRKDDPHLGKNCFIVGVVMFVVNIVVGISMVLFSV